MGVTATSSLTYVRQSGTSAVVSYTVTASTTGSSYNNYDITTTVSVDGQSSSNVHKLPYQTTTTCYSGEFTVGNASGRTISASYSIPTGISAGTLTGTAQITLPTFIKTPTVTCTIGTRDLTSIGASMSVTDNGGASIVDRYIDLFTDSACTNKVGTIVGSSGTFTGLTQNTTYYVRANASNGTYRGYSSVVTTSTQSKATITNAPNINHGSNLTVTYSNPSGSALKIALYTTGGTVLCADRTCTGSSYTFSFTDTELDKIYKQYGNSSTTSPYVILRTANTYYDTKTITITLKGNQKTIRDKVSGTWRRGKIWVKISGTWRQGVIWTKVNGTWRRGI